jgi:hypothetical protein
LELQGHIGDRRRERPTRITDTQPAKKDASAATAKAGPARPWRAIGWPSKQITSDDGSLGMFSIIADVAPEWWDP